MFKLKSIIIHEDQDFLILNKPAGIVVYPDLHHQENTLWDLIKDKLNFSLEQQNKAIIHRLDKPTTGLIIIARNYATWSLLKKQMQEGKITRKYYALVKGIIDKEEFKVDVSLSKPGKHKRAKPQLIGAKAVTYFQRKKILKESKETLLECQLETGRTHQIRAHLKFLKFPIVNDPLYNQGGNEKQIYLHAYYLSFLHPYHQKKLEFKIPLPFIFSQKLRINKS